MNLKTETLDSPTTQRAWVLKDLPPYGRVAKKLMSLTSDSAVPLAKIEEVLRTDAAFAADVLRLANSPLIGARGNIRSVMHAVIFLGLERIKSLATTLALKSFLASEAPAEAIEACWRHNLATAVVCEKLARRCHFDSDAGYTAGLLHDVGHLALLRRSPGEYGNIFSNVHPPDFDLLKCEHSLFGVDHRQAGVWVLEMWEFPSELREVVFLHHTRPHDSASDLLRIVYAGWQIADLLGFSVLKRPGGADIGQIAAFLPGKAGGWVVDQFDGLAEEVAFKINATECSLV